MFYGENIKSNKIQPLTRQKFDELIASGTIAGLDWEVETLLKRLDEGGKTEKEVSKRIAENKRKRPYICTSDFDPNIRSNKNARWSGYCSLDIDHIGDPNALYAERIKGHEQQWGIAAAFLSPSMHGIKIIFKIDKDVTNTDAQAALAHLIGVDYDSSTKDMARATFLVSQSHFYFLDDEFLREKVSEERGVRSEELKQSSTSVNASTTDSNTNSKSNKTRWRTKLPTKRVMMIMEVAMRSRSISRASLAIQGQRHTQLMNLLSSQVAKLITKEEFMGAFRKLCPSYAREDECWRLVGDWYEKYNEDKPLPASFNNTFRQVLNIDDEGRCLSEERGVRS